MVGENVKSKTCSLPASPATGPRASNRLEIWARITKRLTAAPKTYRPILHHVGPDHGGHAALECVKQRQADDQDDGGGLAGTQHDGNNQRNSEHPHAFRQGAGHQENRRGQAPDALAKAAPHQFVGREHLAAKVERKKQTETATRASRYPEDELQETQVSGEGKAGCAYDRERAGFRGNDRQADGPPGRIAGLPENNRRDWSGLSGSAPRTR
jgi:hypothetical protein